jgi:DNA-binding NtrC family response regulator
LREHKEDIPALVAFFLERFAHESGKPVHAITPQAMRLLMDFHWPGNVRELENVIERGVTLSGGSTLEVADIHLDTPPARGAAGSPHILPPGMTMDQWEDETIREALRRANGNKSQAARALGLSRNALRYRLSKMGVPDPPEKEV